MRTITTTTAVYRFDELSAEAQTVAVQRVQEREAARDLDVHDVERITDSIVYKLAEQLGTPGWGEGECSFSGIAHVKLLGCDLDRGQSLTLSGTLDRDNAPALPWVDRIGQVDLIAGRDYTTVLAVEAEPDCECPIESWEHDPECVALRPTPVPAEQITAMDEAVTDAMHQAWQAGRAELESRTSEEYARELCEDGPHEFSADGELHDREPQWRGAAGAG